jgi:hypothetical protein
MPAEDLCALSKEITSIMAPPNTKLEQFVDRLIDTRWDTSSRLAAAIGMSLSAFSRAIHEEGCLSVENCLRLALVSGENPSKILRLVGRDDVAEVTDELFGTEATHLNQRELEHLKLWRKADTTAHDAMDALLHGYVRSATTSGSVKDKKGKKKQERREMLIKARRFPAGSGRGEPRLRASS